MKIPLMLASVLLLGTTVAACGGGDGGDGASGGYCTDIKAAKPVFDSLATGDLAQLEKGFNTFHDLADESPSDLKDAWKTLDGAATEIEKSLAGAGVKMSDLAGIQSGKVPTGVDMAKLSGLAGDLQKLNNADFAKARTAIADQAKDTCKVDLGSL